MVSTHQSEEDARNEHILIWINGVLKPRAEAMVSVYDSGFMLGDGVWEGLRLYNGKWAFLDDHMDRLFEAAKAIDLDIGMTRAAVIAALRHPPRQRDADRCPCQVDGHAWGQDAPLSTSCPVAFWPDCCDHHGAFQTLHPAPHSSSHSATSARLADDAGPQAKLSFQIELYSRLHRRGKGGSR